MVIFIAILNGLGFFFSRLH